MAEMTTMTMPRTHQGVRDLDQVKGSGFPSAAGRPPALARAGIWGSSTA
jgi:hypothetical protein